MAYAAKTAARPTAPTRTIPLASCIEKSATKPLPPSTAAICSRRRAIAPSVNGRPVGIPTRRSSSAISRCSVVIVAGIAPPLEPRSRCSPLSLHRARGGSDLSGYLEHDPVIARQPGDAVVVGVAAALHVEDAD